jgi:hypothetical protein
VASETNTHRRQQAREAINHWHRVLRPHAKRCGARRKHDGNPCEQLALKNGRCRMHGGLTPKGDNWHKPVWPNGDGKNWQKRFARKLQNMEKAAQKLASRLATMTPEQRERYDRWSRTHKPGKASTRLQARLKATQNAEIRVLLASASDENQIG